MAHEGSPLSQARWPRVVALSVVAAFAAVLGIAMLMAPRVADDLGFRWPVSKLHPLTYAWDLLAFLTFGSSFLLFRRAKKHLAPSAATARSRDNRPPILLLRSFRDDETRVLLSGWSASPWGTNTTLEELVVDCLAGHGPVVAIGRPGEALPPLGAAREYVDHGSWQQRVRELVAEAERIVVLGGRTGGLLWELQTIAEMRRLGRVVMVLPQTAGGRAAVWAGMRGVLEQVRPQDLPADDRVIGQGLLVTFHENGEVSLSTGDGTAKSYREALAGIMAQSLPEPGAGAL